MNLCNKIFDIFIIEGVVEREYWNGVGDFVEFVGWCSVNLLCG